MALGTHHPTNQMTINHVNINMKTTQLALALLFITSFLFAQKVDPAYVTIDVKQVEEVSAEWLELFTPNPTIREDMVLNERLMDLVDAYEVDSIVPKKWARHKVVGGGLIALFGRRWIPIKPVRAKFVGTSVRSYQAPDKPQFTEYDLKYNLAPHLDKYIKESYEARQLQLKRNARMGDVNKDAAPFIDPTPETLDKYTFHNELTPPKEYHWQLDSLFFPSVRGTKHEEHVNFGEEKISMGMYGVHVLDCNHQCWPEIHPYEWVWWLELNPAKDDRPHEKRWLVGLTEEASSRFKAWSKGPRRGVVSIPFAFKNEDTQQIHIDHLVTEGMNAEGIKDITETPANALSFTENGTIVDLGDSKISVTSNRPMLVGLKWWLADAQTDGDVTRGYLKVAVSTDILWTSRITFK